MKTKDLTPPEDRSVKADGFPPYQVLVMSLPGQGQSLSLENGVAKQIGRSNENDLVPQKVMGRSMKGLTLIELVTALAIVSIITTLAIYDFVSQVPHRQLKEATQTLISQFQLARQKAITDNREYTVSIEDSTRYNHPVFIEQQTLPHHVSFGQLNGDGISSFDNNSVTFRPDGTIENGTIYLKNSRNEAVEIVLNVTGRIREAWWNGRKWNEKK
jgi:prepilin-type N-terminal cleavage/methylation domain-containing protein